MDEIRSGPGVYVVEVPLVPRTIEAAPTSVTLFLGYALRGPLDRAIATRSWADYARSFGGVRGAAAAGIHDLRAAGAARPGAVPDVDHLGHAVRGFFDNGGAVAVVRRIAAGDAETPLSRASGGILGPVQLRFTAVDEGTWANGLVCEAVVTGAPGGWTVTVGTEDPAGDLRVLERFEGIESGPAVGEAIETAVNGRSALVTITGEAHPAAVAGPRAFLAGGGDGIPDGDPEAYVAALDASDQDVVDAAVVVTPGVAWDTGGRPVVEAVLAHVPVHGRRVVLVDPPRDVPLTDAAAVAAIGLPATTHGALYWPWLVVPNPIHDAVAAPDVPATVIVAPSGLVAGVFARTDRDRGVWKAPAGAATRLTGVAGLRFKTEGERGASRGPTRANVIRSLPGGEVGIWGARTLAADTDSEWKYVNVRRLALMIESSLARGTQWVAFEPNDERLWAALRGAADSFIYGLFRAGAFQGVAPDQAYGVQCGPGRTMTQADLDAGRIILQVMFAPLRPAEFVVIRIGQLTADAANP